LRALELSKQNALAEQEAAAYRQNRDSLQRKSISHPVMNADEEFLDSIKIEVDCSTVKGKLFSMISANMGVRVQDRNFPNSTSSQGKPITGTVKCRQYDIDTFIKKRIDKSYR